MKTILLTGFEPFDRETINPSWELVRRFDGLVVAGTHRVEVLCLPCVFDLALESLWARLAQNKAEIVLCLGQAGGRAEFCLERVAVNINDARIADNAGKQPIDTPVIAGGPVAYFSTLPIKAMLKALHDQGLAAAVSQSAGSFVCNHVFYGLMHYANTEPALGRAGFIHIPYLPEQAEHHLGAPSMRMENLVSCLTTCLNLAVLQENELRYGAGEIS